jgi:hypothetical protein
MKMTDDTTIDDDADSTVPEGGDGSQWVFDGGIDR